MRPPAASEYRLVRDSGQEVPLTADLAARTLTFRPTEPLDPLTSYTVIQAFIYRGDELLTDEQVWQAATGFRDVEPSTEGLERRWYPLLSFRTGHGPEDRLAPLPIVSTATYWTRGGGGSCGPGETLRAELSLAEGLLPTDALALEIRGQGIAWRAPYQPSLDPGSETHKVVASVSDLLCAYNPFHIDVSGTVQVRVLVHSAAGATRAGPWVTAHLKEGDPRILPAQAHGDKPAKRALAAQPGVDRIAAIPFAQEARSALPGPPDCPHGLFATDRRVFSKETWPGKGGGGFTGATDRRWLLVEGEGDESERVVLALGGRGPDLGVLPNSATVTVSGDRVVVSEQGDDGMRGVRLYGADGALIWKRRLGPEGKQGALRFTAIGRDEVLLGWDVRPEAYKRHQRWALLDVDTGQTVAEGDLKVHAELMKGTFAAWDGDRFVVSWYGLKSYAPDQIQPPPSGRLGRGPTFELA
jgi:hypothetical protein